MYKCVCWNVSDDFWSHRWISLFSERQNWARARTVIPFLKNFEINVLKRKKKFKVRIDYLLVPERFFFSFSRCEMRERNSSWFLKFSATPERWRCGGEIRVFVCLPSAVSEFSFPQILRTDASVCCDSHAGKIECVGWICKPSSAVNRLANELQALWHIININNINKQSVSHECTGED